MPEPVNSAKSRKVTEHRGDKTQDFLDSPLEPKGEIIHTARCRLKQRLTHFRRHATKICALHYSNPSQGAAFCLGLNAVAIAK